ncbi:hypothetical protein ACLKMH_17545 [Psychromonas sp. KJ10-10]|uniref:hypothetical protein n=1 Tax=Psychromonas sp. KJ10-10 TaxID=3391823 RepID=UPI0039B4A338
MLSFIQSNNRSGLRTTVKSLLEKFESKPNGWSYAAILCNLASLCAGGKVEVRESTNLLDDKELVRALRNMATHGNLILDPQVEFTPSQIRGVKEFYSDYFEKVAHATEAKAIAKELQESFAEQATELDKLQSQSEQYPFLRVLADIVLKLQEFKTKPYTWFMTELTQSEDTWFDYKEKTIDPILKFMKGPQKSTFDKAQKLVIEQKANIEYVEGNEYQQIKESLVSATIFKGSAIQQLKSDTDTLENKIAEQVTLERKKAVGLVKHLQDKLEGFDDYKSLDQGKQDQLVTEFTRASDKLKRQTLIAMLRDEARQFEDHTYSAQVQKLMTWSQPAHAPSPEPKPTQPSPESQPSLFGDNTTEPTLIVKEPTKSEVRSVSAKQIRVDYSKPWLASKSDVEGYVEEYKKALLAEINDGKHIQL